MSEPRLDEMHQCAGPEGHRWADPADAEKCCRGYARALRVVRDRDGDVVPMWVWTSGAEADERPVVFPFPAAEWRHTMAAFWPEPPHTAWVEALAARDQGSDDWFALNAGLDMLTLVDRWARRQLIRRAPSFRELGALRCAIEVLPSGAAKRFLEAIVKALTNWAPLNVPSLLSLVVAYGDVMAREGYPLLAADVYGSALMLVRSRSEQALSADYCRKMGECLARAGRFDAATAAHELGRDLAQRFGVLEHDLSNRLAFAASRIAAGDIVTSDRTFADVSRDAELWRMPQIRATALHSRALAAYERSRADAERAAVWMFEAHQTYDDDQARERSLEDLASIFVALQYLDVARAIYRYFVAEDGDPDRVLDCGLKAMRLAASSGDQADFDRYATKLAHQEMMPFQLADYFLSLGLGLWRSGRLSRARAAYTRAVRLGEQFQLYQALHDAEQGRARLDAGAAPPPLLMATSVEPAPAVARVIAEVCVLTGTSFAALRDGDRPGLPAGG